MAALSLALAGLGHATTPTQAPAKASAPYEGWAAMADKDIDFSIQWFRDRSILAVYPQPAAFADVLSKARQQADEDLKHVASFEGYRQAMQHFFAVFNDAHAHVSISLMSKDAQWPGFLAVYRGHRFVTAGSEGGIPDGTPISACDGVPMTTWVERIAPYEQIIPGLESTREKAAPLIFRSNGSPFVKRPTSCVIGDKKVDLAWHRIPQAELAQVSSHIQTPLDKDVTIAPFAKDGVWIRLGNFDPENKKQSDQFEALFKAGPSLRDKSVIVLDVRGNGGGPYDWFMGVLRSIYGTDYANYHARARLKIAPVYRIGADVEAPPATANGKPDPSAPAAAPADGSPFDDERLSAEAKARGEKVLRAPVNPHRVPMPATSPANPVHARVLVLTDYRCGSACIGFVDELKRFPGVTQVGTETYVDSRTGTGVPADLPSGNGQVRVPTMTRDGRERDDNEPQKPTLEFDGDIGDTAAVRAWIEHVVLASGSSTP